MYTYKTMMSPKCLHLYFTSCLNFRKNKGRLRFNLYDKRYVFKHPLKLFLWSTILVAPPFEIYISRLVRYNRPCVSFENVFKTRTRLQLNRKILLDWLFVFDATFSIAMGYFGVSKFWFLRGAREPLTFRKKTGNPCQ